MIPPGEQLFHDRFRKQVARSRRVVDTLDGLSREPGVFGAGWRPEGAGQPAAAPPPAAVEPGGPRAGVLPVGHCNCRGTPEEYLATYGDPPPVVDAPGSPCGDQEVYLSAEPGWTYTASSTSIAGSCSATANCEDGPTPRPAAPTGSTGNTGQMWTICVAT